jgi:hypothetical protein
VDLRGLMGSAVEGAPTKEPRPDTSNARSQRPATRAAGVSRALVYVLKLNSPRLNSRGCPQVSGVLHWRRHCPAVIHPVAKKHQRVGAFFPTPCAVVGFVVVSCWDVGCAASAVCWSKKDMPDAGARPAAGAGRQRPWVSVCSEWPWPWRRTQAHACAGQPGGSHGHGGRRRSVLIRWRGGSRNMTWPPYWLATETPPRPRAHRLGK